jgi:hypothetical protein
LQGKITGEEGATLRKKIGIHIYIPLILILIKKLCAHMLKFYRLEKFQVGLLVLNKSHSHTELEAI